MGGRGYVYQQHQGDLVPVQTFHYGSLPQDERQTHGPPPQGTGMAFQHRDNLHTIRDTLKRTMNTKCLEYMELV